MGPVWEHRHCKGALRRLLATLTLTLLASVVPPGWAQVELKLSHTFKSAHGLQTDFLEPWARELERRTQGQVKVKILDGGTRYGNRATQYEQVMSGVVDLAHGMHGDDPGRFPRTELIGMPFLTADSDAATHVLWSLYPKHLKVEYGGLQVLALHAHSGAVLHTQQKKVLGMRDMKGLRVRSPSVAVNKMLTSFGAAALGMPMGQVVGNLRAGLMDGALFSWADAHQLNLEAVTHYHLDGRFYAQSYYFVMNQKRYLSLPAQVRKAIDDISGNALISQFGPWWNKWDQVGLRAVKQRGNAIAVLDDAERARWAGAVTPALDRYLQELEKAGGKNARVLYAEMKRLNKEYSKPRSPR